MRIITKYLEKERAKVILTAAFNRNLSVNSVVKQDKYRLRRIGALMVYAMNVAKLSGITVLSDTANACVILSYPHLKKSFLRLTWLDIMLVIKSIGVSGIARTLKRGKLIAAVKPKVDMAYLWFIGTDPNFQHQGEGSLLMQQVLDFTDRKKLPVYLETSVLENVRWYERFGFEVYQELQLDYKLYFLKREPVNY